MVPEDEVSAIREAREDVVAALEAGEANRLKAAVEALDKATEAVAARMVERAMEEALARRLGS